MRGTGRSIAEVEALDDLGIPPSGCQRLPLRPGTIDRPEAVAGLLGAGDVPLVVIAAPAGYGKTTVAQLWAAADPRPFAWAHLDGVDDDPVHLLRHLAAAMHCVEPLDPSLVRVLTGPGRPLDTDLVPALGAELANRSPFVLIADDVQVLRSDVAVRILEGLLRYLPRGSQVGLIGRASPAMHLSRRRLEGGLFELGMDDLAMDAAEASAVLEQAGAHLDDAAALDLIERTEGWPAGIGLASLALRRGRDPQAISTFSGADRMVAEYLAEEVLIGFDAPAMDFLLRTSVLDRLSVPLLADLFDDTAQAGLLGQLVESGNPFLVPLDANGEWYRYHHMFAEMLRTRFERDRPEEFRSEHAAASRLFERLGDPDQAIRHAVAAGDLDRASDLVLMHSFSVIDEGRMALLRQWLDLLGVHVEHHPSAALARAWYGVSVVDAGVISQAIRSAEDMEWDGPLADGSPTLDAAIAAVRAMVAAEGTKGVVRDCEIIRSCGGPAVNPWWGYATAMLGTVATLEGDDDRARQLLSSGLANLVGSPSMEAGYLGILALTEWYGGDEDDATRHTARALELCEQHNLESVTLVVAAFSAGALLAAKSGRRDEAHLQSRRARRLLARLGDTSARTGLRNYVALSQAALALGEYSDARVLAKDAARARRIDPTCTYLNGLLDEVERAVEGRGADPALDVVPISSAEWRVLAYLPTHMTLQEIAETIHVSRNTVKSHAVAIYRKLGVASRGEAVAEAGRLGLLSVEGVSYGGHS